MNIEMELNSPHSFDGDNEEIIDLEIDFLEPDTPSHQNEYENNEESLTEFMTTSDKESMPDDRNSCIKNGTIPKQSKKHEPKKQIKIMKMQTIEQIVYVHLSFFLILVELLDRIQIFKLIFAVATCVTNRLPVSGNYKNTYPVTV